MLLPLVLVSMDNTTEQRFMKHLYQEHYMKMYRMAFSLTGNIADTEDIIHDACVSLIHKIPVLQKLSPEAQEGYVISTVKNAAYKALRKTKRTTGMDREALERIPDDQPGPDASLLEQASIQDLMAAISKLSEEDQLVLRMKYFEKQTDREIGEYLDIREVSVRSKLARARHRLLYQLEAQDEE